MDSIISRRHLACKFSPAFTIEITPCRTPRPSIYLEMFKRYSGRVCLIQPGFVFQHPALREVHQNSQLDIGTMMVLAFSSLGLNKGHRFLVEQPCLSSRRPWHHTVHLPPTLVEPLTLCTVDVRDGAEGCTWYPILQSRRHGSRYGEVRGRILLLII